MTNGQGQARRFSWMCAVIMVFLYGAALLCYDLKEGTRELCVYAWAAGCSLLAGTILMRGLINYKMGKKKKCILQVLAAFFLLTAGRSWGLGGTALSDVPGWLVLYAKYGLAVFWPFIILAAVNLPGCNRGKERYSDIAAGVIFYNLLVFFGLWILEDVMVIREWEDVDWMMTETAVLAGFSYLVLFKEYISALKGTGRKVLAAGTAAVVNLAGLGFLVCKSPRIRVILYSLGLRLFDANGSIRDVKWMDYRLEAVMANWSGKLEAGFNQVSHNLAEGQIWLTWKKNPLACLNAEYGKACLLLFLLLFIGMLFFAGRISYRNSRMGKIAWYIRAEFIIVSVFSVLSELFLVQNGVGMGNYFPLLGYGVQMLPLLFIVYNLDELGETENTSMAESWGTGRLKFYWKNTYTYLAVLLLLPVLIWKVSDMPFEMDSYAAVTGQEIVIPEETYTYREWKNGKTSYFGKQKQGSLEGFGGESGEKGFFFGNHASGKRDGYGLLKETDGSAWMGRCDDGVMGEGLWIYEDGSWEMVDQSGEVLNENQALNVISYEYGDYYYGEIKDGKPEGYGQYYSPLQEYFYLGEFKNGKRDGSGVCYMVSSPKDISFMEGTWKEGIFSGKGTFAGEPEKGFEEGEWYAEEGKNNAAQLADGSWFYQEDLRPKGIHIRYQSDGRWYYYNAK